MNNYLTETLDEFVTRRNNENINNYNAGYEQALQDILEMIEENASYDEVYESIDNYLYEQTKNKLIAGRSINLKRDIDDTDDIAKKATIGAGVGTVGGSIAGGIGGSAIGGAGTYKLMKNRQEKKLAALKSQGASAGEIAQLQKKQKRNRVLGAIGGAVGGGIAGNIGGGIAGGLAGGAAGLASGKKSLAGYNKR